MTGVLTDKVAVVTGAGRGIGRAIAVEYAREGAHVVVTSRSKTSVDAVVEEIAAQGGSAIGIACDVGFVDAIDSMITEAAAWHGRIDVLVNNAQSFGTHEQPAGVFADRPLEEYPEDEWDWMFETGLKATLRTMKSAFPHMRERGGSIINFGSRRGVTSAPGSAAYNACKEAVRSLSRTAAREWGQHGIRVNIINPNVKTDTAIASFAMRPNLEAEVAKMTPLGHIGEPRDAARAAVFLAGPDSSYITGMTMFVEGGLTII